MLAKEQKSKWPQVTVVIPKQVVPLSVGLHLFLIPNAWPELSLQANYAISYYVLLSLRKPMLYSPYFPQIIR